LVVRWQREKEEEEREEGMGEEAAAMAALECSLG
jgi:hypothetical protein